MVNNKADFSAADFDDNNFKSCFARSVAVNSLHNRQAKSPEMRQLQTTAGGFNKNGGFAEFNKAEDRPLILESPSVTKLRKENYSYSEDNRRFSCHSATNSRRGSLCFNRPLPNIPIENIVFQSQIDTLQWQLKQTEASREMYRAVMKQVVTFLERAHRSLELLGTRLNSQQNPVHRSRSEYHMTATVNGSIDETVREGDRNFEHGSYEDCMWRRTKKYPVASEEIPPEKLSQEAFRLLRTAQSLLNTREPDLAHISNDVPDDLEFLSQLAKEFPQENRPQRITSFSLSPKLLTPDKETRISTALNRKLSLQIKDQNASISTLDESITPNVVDDKTSTLKFEPEKSSSPPVSSVGSAEDESGFSSMNSFQEVGLPLVNSTTVNEETLTREALLKSMLHTDYPSDFSSLHSFKAARPQQNRANDFKLWQKPDVSHKRSSSTPVDTVSNEKITMKVLWV